MGAGVESGQWSAAEHHAASIKVPIVLKAGRLRLSVDPDGSVRHLESLDERRLILGRERLHFYRLRAGVLGQAQKQDWRVASAAREAVFTARVFESVEVSQSVRILSTSSAGYSRRVTLRNGGPSVARLRLIALYDPTAAHFREHPAEWGSIGVNAFNRASHVAIDEAVEPMAARVIGAQPPPALFYMTSDRSKALGLVQRGELPEQTAGMSGQVLVLAEHELDLPPGGSREITYASLYNPSKLEAALSDFGALPEADGPGGADGAWFACSSGQVTSAFGWALAGLEGAEYEEELFERLETLRGLALVDPEASKRIILSARAVARDDGSLPHSLDPWRPGVLETSVFLDGASRLALLGGDKRYIRSVYPALRRAGNFLLGASQDGAVRLDAAVAQGWRRKIGRGYPTGELPEVSLSVAAALAQAASVASRIGKAQDSAKFKERSAVIAASARKRLVDDNGFLALNADEGGRLRVDETVDQAVACYRYLLDRSVASSLVHRLLERDFDTGYGPRTLPSSNRMFFNPSYGEGQVGGYWTRAALAHAILAYLSGFGGTGCLEVEAIGRLACADVVRYGGAPGDFPYWLDPERKEAHGRGSDPVAASRYVEAAIAGELGVSVGPGGLRLSPSLTSGLRWVAAGGILGGKASAFVGRAGGKVFTFAMGGEVEGENGSLFSGSERARTGDPRTSAVSFFGPGQVVCAGNSSEAQTRTTVAFNPRAPEMTRQLTTGLHELDTQSGSWRKVSTVRVLPSMAFEVSLGPGEWKAFKVSS